MDNISIKEHIRKSRKESGMTQEEMAHRLDISLTAYRDLEKGATSIINGNIQKIAEITGKTPEELLLGYRPTQTDDRLEDLQVEYGNKVNALMKRISDLERIVSLLEDTLASKNEIIGMLKKNIDEER